MSDKLDEKALEAAFDVLWPVQEWNGEERVCRASTGAAITAYLQALGPGSTGEAEGWRDIKSAPKDGQKVLACWAGRTNNMMIVWYEDWTWHAMIGGWKSVVPDEPPTHWMPLPSPPSAMLAAAGGKDER